VRAKPAAVALPQGRRAWGRRMEMSIYDYVYDKKTQIR
jgi:hypothetical protein